MPEPTILESLGLPAADESKIPLATNLSEASLLREELDKDMEKNNSRGFIASAGTAYSENLSVKALADSVEKMKIVDVGAPISYFTPELITQLTEGLPAEAAEEVLQDARDNGFQTAMKQREFALNTLRNRKQLEADGVTGMVANAFSVMFDPPEWAAIIGITAATTALTTPAGGAVALTAGALKQAYNVKRAFKVGALATAAESAAFEAIRANVKYDIDANDVFIAGGVGALLGGSLNAGRIAFKKAGDRSLIAQKVIRQQKLTPNEQAFHDAFNVDELAQKIIQRELTGDTFIESIKGKDITKSFTKLTDEDVSQIPEQAGWNMFGLRKILSAGALWEETLQVIQEVS